MKERKRRQKQQCRTKLIQTIMIGILLCGCSAQPVSEIPVSSQSPTPEQPRPSQTPVTVSDKETLLRQFLDKKGLLKNMNSISYELSHDYQFEMTDTAWNFTDSHSGFDILVDLIKSEIVFTFPDVAVEYKKKDRIVRTAVFSAQLTMPLESSGFSWNSEIVTEDHQRYVVQFDPKTLEIQDAEPGSKTLGQKMNFAPSLYGQCLSFFKRYWNHSITQRMTIKAIAVTAKKIERGMDPDNITVRIDAPLENSVDVLEPGAITPDIALEVEMNFNDQDSISLKNANRFQKTLYLFTAMDRGFDNPALIDWEALAPILMSVSPKYGCDVKCCRNADGQIRFADFAIREGYGALVTQPDMNQAAKVLTGQDYVYDDYDNRKLSSGVVYSQSVNSYVCFSRDGDWMPSNPGVMVLNEVKADNRITVDFVTYVPKWDHDKIFVEGVPVNLDQEDDNANLKIIQTVKNNLDRMQHWTAELEDTGDEHFYRLLWAVRY